MREVFRKYHICLFRQQGEEMKEKVIIILKLHKKGFQTDLEVPLDITANDLIFALNEAYDLQIDVDDIRNCYLKMERPVALLHGNKKLAEYGMRNGSIIHITD